MSYASNADVQQRMGNTLYVQLTDDAGSGAADEARVTQARQAAEGEVNSHLGRRYIVPVDAVGDTELQALLQSITLDLVEYRLHARRPPVPADIATKHAAALGWLQQAAAGTVVLSGAAELPAESDRSVVAATRGSPRVCTREELSDL